jgi:hypothetical protein
MGKFNMRFHSLNEARTHLGKVDRSDSVVLDYWKYCSSMVKIRELVDTEYYFLTAWNEQDVKEGIH